MDFRIPGLPHSVVKHAQSTSVRELIQKIENHPDRHALQQDLRQNESFNPFSPESKQMISNCVNCSRRKPRRSAKHAYHTGILASSIAHAGISCRKKQRAIENSLNIQWIFFQSQSMSSRKEDLLDTDVDDRFLQDQEFRIRMIENHRDKEVCRRWDALADEDHTHHLAVQEYFHYKNKWWLF